MFKYIIVDDEPLAHEIIEELCSMIPHVKLMKNCYNAMEAMAYLNENQVDFMFLDINMPKLRGLDFLRTLSNPPKTIVTTAYQEFALEGFELEVVDYLLKPFSFDRLVKAINKVTKTKKSDFVLQPKEAVSSSFFIKGDKKHHQIELDRVLFIEAFGNYTKLFLADETIISHDKISHYDEFLDSEKFMRVHKSFIVSIKKIKFIEGNRIIIQDHKVPIGQTYKSKVNSLLRE
ncbi:MAG: LytR/AlgR family response regulator transcription factor [Flavobacteriaceae bacterium]